VVPFTKFSTTNQTQVGGHKQLWEYKDLMTGSCFDEDLALIGIATSIVLHFLLVFILSAGYYYTISGLVALRNKEKACRTHQQEETANAEIEVSDVESCPSAILLL
jgi:hypothetical protein